MLALIGVWNDASASMLIKLLMTFFNCNFSNICNESSDDEDVICHIDIHGEDSINVDFYTLRYPTRKDNHEVWITF